MRTMKLLMRWNANLSPGLAVFLATHLEQDERELVGSARSNPQAQFFLKQQTPYVRKLLEKHLENTPLIPFQMPESQGVLPSLLNFGKRP